MTPKERVINGAKEGLSEYLEQSHNVTLLEADVDEIVQIVLKNTHQKYLTDSK